MQKWFTYNGKEPEELDPQEIYNEIVAQRALYKVLKRSSDIWKWKVEEYEKEVEEFKQKEGALPFRVARKEATLHRRKVKAECFTICADACKTFLTLCESLHATRGRGQNKHKGLLTDKKRKDYTARRQRERTDFSRVNGMGKYWNKEAFLAIAKDRGYTSEETLISHVAKSLGVAEETVKKMLNKGRFTWGQVLGIGYIFEMTPREFAECFMRGYFTEISDGKWRAWGDPKSLSYLPLEVKKPETIIMVDESGEPKVELDYYKVNWE